MTERPGEFSKWYFSSYLENSDVRLYPTHTENLKTSNSNYRVYCSSPACWSQLITLCIPCQIFLKNISRTLAVDKAWVILMIKAGEQCASTLLQFTRCFSSFVLWNPHSVE